MYIISNKGNLLSLFIFILRTGVRSIQQDRIITLQASNDITRSAHTYQMEWCRLPNTLAYVLSGCIKHAMHNATLLHTTPSCNSVAWLDHWSYSRQHVSCNMQQETSYHKQCKFVAYKAASCMACLTWHPITPLKHIRTAHIHHCLKCAVSRNYTLTHPYFLYHQPPSPDPLAGQETSAAPSALLLLPAQQGMLKSMVVWSWSTTGMARAWQCWSWCPVQEMALEFATTMRRPSLLLPLQRSPSMLTSSDEPKEI